MNKNLLNTFPFFFLILLSFLWGTSFFMIKNGLEELPPNVLAALRMVFGTIFFIPFAIRFYKHTKISKIPVFFLIGIIGNTIPAFLFSAAQTHVSSSVSGIINSTSPLFTFLLGVFFFGIKFTPKKMLGVFLGMLGVILLVFINGDGKFEGKFGFGLMIVLATVLYGLASNIAAKYTSEVRPIVTAAWSMIPVGVLNFIYLIFFTDALSYDYNVLELQYAVAAVAYLGFIATGIGTFIYFKLIKMRGALFASTVTYLMPLVAVLWGIFSLENFHIFIFVGLALILSAVYFINKK